MKGLVFITLLTWVVFFLNIDHAVAQSINRVKKDTVLLKEASLIQGYMSKIQVAKTLDVQYLKRDRLLQSQGNTFMNTLEKLPGISAIHTGVGISKPVIRGMSLNRVIVNEYGIKQEGQQWGVDHGLEIDQYNVDRVEVIKGPVAVIYGSDGIGGVINILPPLIPSEDTISAEIISTYKSNNDLWGLSGRVLVQKKGNYILARATMQDYASYKVPAKEFVYNGYKLPIHNNRLKNTGGQELNFSLLTGIHRTWGSSSIYISNFRQQAGFFMGAFGVPRAYQLHNDGNFRKIDLPHQYINHTKIVSNTSIFWKQWKLESDVGFQRNTRIEMSPPHAHGYGAAPEGNEALALNLYTVSTNIRLQYFINSKLNNTIGLSFQNQRNIRGGYEFLIPSYTFSQIGLYNFTEYQHSKNLYFNAGVRVDLSKQHAAAATIKQYDSLGNEIGQIERSTSINKQYQNVSGSVGASLLINKNWSTKLNVGTAYRIPTMAELTANGVHHGTFRHEMGDHTLATEQGYMFDWQLAFKQQRINVQITPFVNYFSNYIYLSPSAKFSVLPDAGQIYKYMGAKTLFAGVEWHADWQIIPELVNNISIEYVWNKNIESGLGLPFTPPMSFLEEITWQPKLRNNKYFSNTAISLSGQYFAAQKRVDRNEPITDDYMLFNASLSSSFKIKHQQFTVFLQLRNITNTLYMNNMSRYRILNLPEQGFNTQLMLRWTL